MTTDFLLRLPDSTAVLDEAVLPTAWPGCWPGCPLALLSTRSASALVDQAVAVLRRPGFDTLLSLPQLAFEPFDYQRETASTVLRRMRGRAILADEVGLGKTIEAGLVLSELRLRGLAERALVLTPAGLVEQWRDELERKFSLPTAIVTGRSGVPDCRERRAGAAGLAGRGPPGPAEARAHWRRVGSGGRGRGTPAAESANSASGKLVRALTARYLLLLTATPVENRLQDLYEMISLVAPGLLGTPAQFRARYGRCRDDAASAAQPGRVAGQDPEVMVRHRRSEVALRLPQRLAETVLVPPDADERALYADAGRADPGPREGRDAGARLALRSVARLAGSTPGRGRPDAGQTRLGRPGRAGRGHHRSGQGRALLVRQLGEHTAKRREGAGVHRVPADPGRAGRIGAGRGNRRGRLPRQPVRARRRKRRSAPSATTCRSCCPPNPPARAATCSSATS